MMRMNRRGVVTLIEMVLLAILTISFILVYTTTAEQSRQDILLKVLGTESQERCDLFLLSVYRSDYVRYKEGADFSGSYGDLRDFYGTFPISFSYSGKSTMESYSGGVIVEGTAGECTAYLFDPYNLIYGGNPFYPVSMSGLNE